MEHNDNQAYCAKWNQDEKRNQGELCYNGLTDSIWLRLQGLKFQYIKVHCMFCLTRTFNLYLCCRWQLSFMSFQKSYEVKEHFECSQHIKTKEAS